jgi:quinol monooxygenase YgiN
MLPSSAVGAAGAAASRKTRNKVPPPRTILSSMGRIVNNLTDNTPVYIVIVDFRIKAERVADFMPLMLENARASRETEPGCRVFDVCVDPADKTSVFLYEVYDDRAAFDAHLATAHFKRFDAAVAAMVAAKSVRTLIRKN